MQLSKKSILNLFVSFSLILIANTGFTLKQRLTVTSTAFVANGMIPIKYSCEGAEVNPPIIIAGIPTGTKSLAITVYDPDAPKPGGVTHWVAWNLPVDGNIPENFKGGVQGLNSDHKPGYKGMCPPSGTHHYHFTVFAVDTVLTVDSVTDKAGLESALKGHILAEGELIGLYSKSKP
jgi:Raf kinase inhibitor-like YbhB/YbcL family protein